MASADGFELAKLAAVGARPGAERPAARCETELAANAVVLDLQCASSIAVFAI
jgi:hypothetical protein